MSDNKLVKTIMDATTITGLAAGIGWVAKKVVKENFTSDPSTSRTKKSFPPASEINDLKKTLL